MTKTQTIHAVLLIGGMSFYQKDRETKLEQLAFMQEVLGKGTRCCMAFMDDLLYTVTPGSFQVYDTRNKIDLGDIDVVFIRGMERVPVSAAYYLSRYCAWSDKPCISDYSIYTPPDKVAQAILFLEHGVSFLKTMYSPNNRHLITAAAKTFGHPYILKATNASHGDRNYLINSQGEAKEVIANNPDTAFLAQEFCPNEFDYRLLLMGDDYLLFKRSSKPQSHLNNTSKGAQATKETDVLPAHIVAQSKKLASALGLRLAGVDIIPHRETGQLYFLEVNVQPQLRTGAFLSEKKELIHRMFEKLY